MKKCVLMSVDISEGSDYCPNCDGIFDYYEDAKEAAIKKLNAYKDEMKAKHNIDISVYTCSLTANDEYGTYGMVFHIDKIVI
jgi:hypothetical protein